MSVSRKLETRRATLRHTQREAADAMRVNRESVGRWERGQPVSVRMRGVVARYLGEPVETLFENDGDPVETKKEDK